MRALIVILFWLILGFFYWQAKKTCCANALPSVTSVSETFSKTKSESPSLASTDNAELLSEKKIDTIDQVITTVLEEENTTYFFMNQEFDRENIPSDYKEQLKKIASRMSGDISSICLVSYSDDKTKSRRWIRYSEDYLIKKGIIPSRIKVIKHKQGKRENEIMELVITE